ncbi:FAD-dependent monooxygenase [Streptomyces sp. NPDC055607]
MKVLVVGAGIGGLSTAVALRRRGLDVEVYERACALKPAGTGLSVMSNALAALSSIGVDLDLSARGRAVTSFHVLTSRGGPIRELPLPEVCERVGAPSVCISRSALQEALLEAAGDLPIHLSARAVRVESDARSVRVGFQDGRRAEGDVLIGADGLRSTVRAALHGPDEPVRDSGYLCYLGIAPFDHPALSPGAVRHYWGRGKRFGLIDIGHGRYYWWGTEDMPEERSAAWTGDRADVQRVYAGWADEVEAVIRATPDNAVLAVPSRDRRFLDRWGDGRVTLLGDAAHPMLTSLGQGSAMAVEDAAVLAGCLSADTDPVRALRAYEDLRRDRTRWMVESSRSFSAFEQGSTPLRRWIRDTTFRLAPRPLLVRSQEKALRFPGAPVLTEKESP